MNRKATKGLGMQMRYESFQQIAKLLEGIGERASDILPGDGITLSENIDAQWDFETRKATYG